MVPRATVAEEVAAVARVAAGLGLGTVAPVVVSLAHHTTVRLAPLPLVARVRSSADLGEARAGLARELAIARHLVAGAAPVVRPARDVSPGPHVQGRCAMTIWAFTPHRAAASDADAWGAACALRRVHAVLARFGGVLPLFTTSIEACAELVADRRRTPGLGTEDRQFLAAVHARLLGTLGTHAYLRVPIHGDAHLGNALLTEAGVIWGDLEAVCSGPREWDVACLPPSAWPAFDGIDLGLTSCLADLRSLCVAAWCWADQGRNPEADEAAEHHLRTLRKRFG